MLWLDKCGYIVSEAWRRAVGLESKVFGHMEEGQLATLLEENAQLRRDLECLVANKDAQDDLERQLAALGDENASLRTQLEGQTVSSPTGKSEGVKQIEKLQRRIKQLTEGPANPSEKSALTRKVACLEKALLGAACDAYSFDPRAKRSDAAKQIADKTTQLGCPTADSTVRDYLRESASIHVDSNIWDLIYSRK